MNDDIKDLMLAIGWLRRCNLSHLNKEELEYHNSVESDLLKALEKAEKQEQEEKDQRKQLTDEEIEEAAKSVPSAIYTLMCGDAVTVQQFRKALTEFARAIEAAHGIKGEV